MLNSKILDRARRLIETKLEECQDSLPEEVNRILRKMQIAGHGRESSVTYKLVHKACRKEVQEKAEIVWDSIQKAHYAFGSPITETLATDLKTEASFHIEKIVKEASELIAKRLRFNEPYGHIYNLESAKCKVTKKIDVEIDLYFDSLVSKPAETEQKNTLRRRIWTWTKRIPRWIYILVIFLGALFTCLYYLGWLEPIKAFIYKVVSTH